ncbi:hypothetical protein QN277_008775 [Acacia crassicarpa]|uniref:Uncharacterized protein n=1 Tax=Acacia crassicarpa TaxID=499986 RepID=A0AAE1JQJ1_9FABA|nr:hypothetical protein QN277_008775 [Acacia crassicarpa]
MAPSPDTRSQERLDDLECRFETFQATIHAGLDQGSQDINDLKQIALRLEEGMKSMEVRVASLTVTTGKQAMNGNGGTGGPEGSSGSTILGSRFPAFGSFHEL